MWKETAGYTTGRLQLKTPPPVDIFKDFKFDVIKLLEGEHPAPPPRVCSLLSRAGAK